MRGTASRTRGSADIHLLQEVNRSQGREIRDALGANAAFGPVDRSNMILTRLPILEWAPYEHSLVKIRNCTVVQELLKLCEHPTNHFVWARVAHPSRPINLFSVHYPLAGDIPGWEDSYVNFVITAKHVRDAVMHRTRGGREATILSGDFNQDSADIDCSIARPPDCLEDVFITPAARLFPAKLRRIDGAHLSAPSDGSLPGFAVRRQWMDSEAARVVEHAPELYDLVPLMPSEATGCADARNQARAIVRSGLSDAEKQAQLAPLESWAAWNGRCDRLVATDIVRLDPWTE